MNIYTYDHPKRFKFYTRVLKLVGRNKDGAEYNERYAISQNEDEFDQILKGLQVFMQPGDRIYGTINPRSIQNAAKVFEERRMNIFNENLWSRGDISNYYRDIPKRWASALIGSPPSNLDEKLWLFDCDNLEEYKNVTTSIIFAKCFVYEYPTKREGGYHIITNSFNLYDGIKPSYKASYILDNLILLKRDAMILWSYDKEVYDGTEKI